MWKLLKLRRLYGGLVACILFPSCVIFLYSAVSIPTMKVKLRLIPNEIPLQNYKQSQLNVFDEPANLTDIRKFRHKTINNYCQNLRRDNVVDTEIPPKTLSHIIVDDRYKVLFCYIPKVACTNLKRVFLLLTGKMNATNPMELKAADVHNTYDKYLTYLDSFSKEEIFYKLANYKKIIMVREPFERLLSAYRNKFVEKSPYFQKRFGRKILKKYRLNATPEEIEQGKNVTFQEFVHYITDPVTRDIERYNEHWDHYNSLCQPCLINYDFIGKYETLDYDINYFMHSLGIDSFIKFPKRGAAYKKMKTKDTFDQYYRNISTNSIVKLWRNFKQDYKMFSYPVPNMVKKIIKERSGEQNE